jgi:hypothetical protein
MQVQEQLLGSASLQRGIDHDPVETAVNGSSLAQFIVALNAPGTTGVHVNPLLVL